MIVRCENFRSRANGKFQGFCDLVIEPPGIRLYSCELFRSGTSEWVSFPSRPYESRDGQRKFARILDFATLEGYESFKVAALEAIREFRSSQPVPPQTGSQLRQSAG
jgi:hypothetical protein